MSTPEWRWMASMYVDAVFTELTIRDKTDLPLGEDYNEDGSFREDSPALPRGDKSYSKLAEHVYEALLALDYNHPKNGGKTMAEQSPEWKAFYAQYKTWRKDKGLGNIPPSKKSILNDRAVILDRAELELLLERRSDSTLTRFLRDQSRIYHETFPGLSSKYLYHNSPINILLSQILRSGLGEREDLEKALRWLRYRFEVITIGNRYVEFLGLDRPCFQTCEDFNVYAFENNLKRMGPEVWDTKERCDQYRDLSKWFWEKEHAAYEGVTAARFLFPEPQFEDGKRFAKGGEYIVAALWWTAYTKEKCFDIMEGLMQHVQRGVRIMRELVKNHPEVLEKRRKVAEAWDVRLRGLEMVKEVNVDEVD